MYENKHGVSIFPKKQIVVKLTAELIYRITKYRRPLKLLEMFLESPGKVLEFQIQLTVVTLIISTVVFKSQNMTAEVNKNTSESVCLLKHSSKIK